jgi:hypothetical protein
MVKNMKKELKKQAVFRRPLIDRLHWRQVFTACAGEVYDFLQEHGFPRDFIGLMELKRGQIFVGLLERLGQGDLNFDIFLEGAGQQVQARFCFSQEQLYLLEVHLDSHTYLSGKLKRLETTEAYLLSEAEEKIGD